MRTPTSLVALILSALALSPAAASAEYDDCDAKFIAFSGSSAYQFSPSLKGDLGRVRLFSILSYQKAAALQNYGSAYWHLEIRGQVGSANLVRESRGMLRIERRGAGLAEFVWDGRDADGHMVEPGAYHYTFSARFLSDRAQRTAHSFDELAADSSLDAAQETTRTVIVDYTLSVQASKSLRASLASTSCQTQQNTSMEAGFPYSFYYGSTHSHSNYSDGGQPTGGCSSGAAYGSGTFTPAQVYDYARNTAGLDYWVVNEHNHLINDSVATNNAPVTEAKVRQRYQDGRNQAAAANVDGTFVAIYGMEWGVTSNNDQGHVTLLETPVLFGWESCTTCNGPAAECTPGTNCYFDVFTPKRYGYLTMYQRSVENPSSAGALGILCHPGSGEFDNYAFNGNADEALQGIAVRSGLAFSTASNCADANVGATDYSVRWKAALDKGFHLAPTGDHDSHCNNFGVALPTRTVYLVPSATGKTKAGILAAHKARHFYATEDSNLQLIFGTVGDVHIMGDIFTVTTTTGLRAAVYDPNGETVSTLELWRGQIGTGVPTSPLVSLSNQSTLSFTDAVPTGSYYYYIHGVQADGNEFWSAPMWITYNLTGCTVPPSPVAGNDGPACVGGTLHLTASDVPGATYSWTGPNGFTDASQNPTISNIAANQGGTYNVVATVAACPSPPASTSVVVLSPTTSVTAPSSLCPESLGVASVPDGGPGTTYAWTVTNGTLVSGQGTRTITFGTSVTGTTLLQVSATYVQGCTASGSANVTADPSCVPATAFYALTPCRVFDTRDPDGPFGGPVMAPSQVRTFTLVGTCGIPPAAISVSTNLTITQPAASGFVRAYAGDAVTPNVGGTSFSAGRTRANNTMIRLGTDQSGDITVENVSGGTTHVILDVNGYFAVPPPPVPTPTAEQLQIRINEVDADQTSTDTAEFVELIAPAGTSLDHILMVFHNGSAGGFAIAGYRTQNLTGQSFPLTPFSGGTKSLFVLGPSALPGFTSQPYNVLFSTGWPASNAVQNAGSNEGDGLLVAFDTNLNGAYDDGVDQIIDKFAYVQGTGTDGGANTAAGFKAIYGSTGSTYLVVDTTTSSMGKNTNTIPAASGSTFDYTTNNVNSLTPSPGSLNAGQSTGI